MREDHAPQVRFHPPLVFLAGLLAGVAIDHWLTGWTLPIHGAGRWLAVALLGIAGLACASPALRSFWAARENPLPHTPGNQLIISGIYRYTRNPMYLGMALLYAAVALACRSSSALLILPAVLAFIQLWVIRPEEDYLSRRFGEEYLRYRQRVRRWL